MDISGRLSALRHEMEREHIDIYIIPSEDYHQSEYVGEYFKAREFISGFTGSAGTAVITPDKAGLWTDGRYFIQAEQELAGTGITLYRMGEPGVDTIRGFLEKELPSQMEHCQKIQRHVSEKEQHRSHSSSLKHSHHYHP